MSVDPNTETAEPHSSEPKFLTRVLVTGATGFVGRAIVRELVARGHFPVCLVRDRDKFKSQNPDLMTSRYDLVAGDLFDADALAQAATGAEAAIHLVGIIFEHPLRGQTFQRIHVEGTRRVVDACKAAGIRRYVHMSALGARPNAVSEYHQTKWAAENYVRGSGLDWTIFRPSVIHGPEGEFIGMMKTFVCKWTVPVFGFLPAPFPVIPYFGRGENRLQPVDVRDVASCFVSALSVRQTIGEAYELGGPEAITWKELYRICRETIPCAKHRKPIVGLPVWKAKMMAATVMKLPLLPATLRFNKDQVEMSQEDSVCDTKPVQEMFGIRLRDFRRELANYAAMIP